MAISSRPYMVCLLAFTVLPLVPAVTSRAEQLPPVAEQMAKTYGLDSFGQIEGIRYTWNAEVPGKVKPFDGGHLDTTSAYSPIPSAVQSNNIWNASVIKPKEFVHHPYASSTNIKSKFTSINRNIFLDVGVPQISCITWLAAIDTLRIRCGPFNPALELLLLWYDESTYDDFSSS